MHIFHIIYCLNMAFSLIMKLTDMMLAMYVAGIHWEGSVFQNSDIDLTFSFMIFRRVNF